MTHPEILSGARTVIQLNVHFHELKAAVEQMLANDTIRKRGYFLPTEEEECQHLLVSYWHSRNALLDLVLGLRDDPAPSKEAFLVGYAGALLLVDAARFLHAAFDDIPVIRNKLNQPVPTFGVPDDVYDTVQRSLTSPVNLWRLYQAAEYYECNEGSLRVAAQREPFHDVLPIIETLQQRIRTSALEYIPARFRVRTRQCIDGVGEDVLGRMMYRMQRMMSTLASAISVRPTHRSALPDAVIAQLKESLQPGDVFITRKEFALTNYFLPGYWPHAALYLGKPETLEARGIHQHEHTQPRWSRLTSLPCDYGERVLEALKDGVWIRSVRSPFSSDSIVVIRPHLDVTDVNTALARGFAHDGKPYDFDFDFTRSDRLVCTEVVYRSYEGVGGMQFPLTKRAGRLTLGAGDLIRMAQQRQHFEIVAAYIPNASQTICWADEANSRISEWLESRGMTRA